tara:strand:+ start:412 stop:558 length:147 start_codon:yes stop_codon:yes gene_type:complete
MTTEQQLEHRIQKIEQHLLEIVQLIGENQNLNQKLINNVDQLIKRTST